MDGLRLSAVTFVPEISLYLAEDATLLWARLEAHSGRRLSPPYWASAWAGGQALARYVLDHPEVVAGRRVLDLASGSGLVAVAAARAGAASVVANDIDPYAIAAVRANAAANRVEVEISAEDLLDEGHLDADVILTGDGLYEKSLARRVLGFLSRQADGGTLVLVGDPDRGHVEDHLLDLVATYRHPHAGPAEDHQRRTASVFQARSARR
jgi:predicted nicotinamide N-methyase